MKKLWVKIGQVYESHEEWTRRSTELPTPLMRFNTVVKVTGVASDNTTSILNGLKEPNLILCQRCRLTDFDGYKPEGEIMAFSQSSFEMYFKEYNEGRCTYSVYEYLRSKKKETRHSIGVVSENRH